jgi:PRTRC genetic system ThiF family protein
MSLQLALEPTYLLDVKSNVPKHFIIIGAGGNGGYFIPQLARAVSLSNRIATIENRPHHSITIIDADEVEDKNLTRQNFLPIDVGQNKAAVMAARYGRAFGIEINYIDKYLEGADALRDVINSNGAIPVIVGAVDNNKTRAIIYDVFSKRPNTFWLDAGNEEWAGQVVLGYNSGGRKPQVGNKAPHLFDVPSVCDIYPEIKEATDKLPTELSCAERAVSNPQNIYTNMTAANILMGFANTILTAKAQDGAGLKQHAVVFNAETISQSTTLNKYRFLVKEEEKQEEKSEVKA